MKNLVSTNTKVSTIDSREVAEMLGKKHDQLLRDIKNYSGHLAETKIGFSNYFIKSSYINSQNKEQPCYLCTKMGMKYIIDKTRNDNINKVNAIKWYNDNFEICYDVIVIEDRFELSFFKRLDQTLIPLGYEIEKQKQVLNYRLDGYIKELNLVIEYDEGYHNNQKEEDLLRQKEIEKELGCKFVRLNYKNTDSYNIGMIVKEIINILTNLK